MYGPNIQVHKSHRLLSNFIWNSLNSKFKDIWTETGPYNTNKKYQISFNFCRLSLVACQDIVDSTALDEVSLHIILL